MIREVIEVFFDSEFRATRIERRMHARGYSPYAFDADVDLSTQQVLRR
jgi:hypothetical protein